MWESAKAPVIAIVALVSLAHVATAWEKVTPCVYPPTTEKRCSYCDDSMSIDVTPWREATTVSDFHFANASAQTGGGYNVYWDIFQPDHGCRALLFDPYKSDNGSIEADRPGNVILSVSQAGCYFTNIDSSGVSVGYCCGTEDCQMAGAIPGLNREKRKRELPPSNITHSWNSTRGKQNVGKVQGRHVPVAPVGLRLSPPSRITRALNLSNVAQHSGDVTTAGWRNSNPFEDKEIPVKPKVKCSKPSRIGSSYTKVGDQTIEGKEVNCNGGSNCDQSGSVSVSVASSVSNEHTTTITNSEGVSLSMTAGVMLPMGPTLTVTAGATWDWSNAVAESMSETRTETISKTLSWGISLLPGFDYNAWFSPTLRCQQYKMTCNGVKQVLESCHPIVNADGSPQGETGIMVVG